VVSPCAGNWGIRMSDLIKAAVSIKDPFTLFAFLALLLLIAFRTKSVPEALFKLVGDKMTRERFSQQMRRAFLYVFLAFLALCGLAVTGQVLGYMTTAKAASVEELNRNSRSVAQTIARRDRPWKSINAGWPRPKIRK